MSVTIHNGDALTVLRTMDAESINCCVTSPPYFGLRDYGHAGQIGLEPTPEAFVAALVAVFSEVHRVLREDGTLWLNLGDSYAGSGRGAGDVCSTNKGNGASRGVGSQLPAGFHESARQSGAVGRAWVKPPEGLKAKDLIGIPWRVAFALQAAGWYLRSDIIWHKPNPMPESVTDRCTKSHEYIFMLSKSERYHYDADAVKEDAVCGWNGSEFHTGKTAEHQLGRASTKRDPRTGMGRLTYDGKRQGGKGQGQEAFVSISEKRNRRSVWTVPTAPYSEAHFATFPPDLIRPCILAGCPAGGTVLDPFGGSGTTGEVAEQEGRHSVLIELNPEYVKLAKKRTAQTGLLHCA